MKRGTLFWGFVLIILGLALLLDNLGILGNIDIWNLLWPLFLIALGAWILFGRVVRRAPTTEHVSIPLEGAQSARVRVGHGAGRLDVYAGSGLGNLAEGDFTGGLDYRSQLSGDVLEVKMRPPETYFVIVPKYFPFDLSPGLTLDWSFGLTADIPLSLDFETGASESRLNLRDLRLTELRLKTGASSTSIDLPANAGQTRATIESGAASVNIAIPEGVAARIRTQGGLSTFEVDTNRFPQVGGVYQSPDYDTATNRIDMDIQMGVGSVKIY
ncbi:MAG TPA: DUF5668 domain-containing protein [Anaerolineales bacterium]